jgi:ABC-2 type transport system permease protein
MIAIRPRTQGFRPILSKELHEWWARRAALVIFLAVAALGAIGTLATRIDETAGGVPDPAMLASTANVLNAKFDQWVVMAAILGTIGLLTAERGSGTLAWTLSKPVSRTALLGAKWTGAVMVTAVAAVALPLLVSVGIATVAYGGVPDIATVATFGLLLVAAAAFFVALDLALATRIDSQAGIAAIALAFFAAPFLLAGVLPALAVWWPTSIGVAAVDVASGAPLEVGTVLGWAAGLIVVGVLGAIALDREEL